MLLSLYWEHILLIHPKCQTSWDLVYRRKTRGPLSLRTFPSYHLPGLSLQREQLHLHREKRLFFKYLQDLSPFKPWDWSNPSSELAAPGAKPTPGSNRLFLESVLGSLPRKRTFYVQLSTFWTFLSVASSPALHSPQVSPVCLCRCLSCVTGKLKAKLYLGKVGGHRRVCGSVRPGRTRSTRAGWTRRGYGSSYGLQHLQRQMTEKKHINVCDWGSSVMEEGCLVCPGVWVLRTRFIHLLHCFITVELIRSNAHKGHL